MTTQKHTKTAKPLKLTSTIARADDGTIQATYSFPWKVVKEVQEHVVTEEAEKMTLPGFRKGKAPLSKVREKISQATLIEHTVSHLYPQIITDILENHRVKPVIYPKIEILKAVANEDWEIRAVTCEAPNVDVDDYRKHVLAASKVSQIWTPDKGKDAKAEEPTREQKEQAALTALLTNIKVNVPKVLVDDEVNSRLSQLLARIERLGLQLESYLGSVGKTPESLRQEYEEQAKSAIALEFILSKIAEKENIKIEDSKVEEAIKATGAADPKLSQKLTSPEQKNVVRNILQRRAVLDSLVALL